MPRFKGTTGPYHGSVRSLALSLGIPESTVHTQLKVGGPRKGAKGFDEANWRRWCQVAQVEVAAYRGAAPLGTMATQAVPQDRATSNAPKLMLRVKSPAGWKPQNEYDKLFGAPRNWQDAEKRERTMQLKAIREREKVKLDRLRGRLLTIEQVQEEQTALVEEVAATFRDMPTTISKFIMLKTRKERDAAIDKWVNQQMTKLSQFLKEKEE